MPALLGLFLFSVLLRTGTSLECEVCSGFGSSCTGSMETCYAGQDTCVITLSENSLAGEKLQMVTKACGYSYECKMPAIYQNFGSGKYTRSFVTCCAGDACKTATPQFPPAMTTSNGKQCPGSYCLSPFGCETETVDCVGEENYCLDIEEKITYGKFVMHITMKGCVTKEVCAVKEGETSIAGGQADVIKAGCKPASVAN
ncbi:phospholipase A2 inhibitor NAI-like [Hemicordylus capensis]|uniref:phospholipase A2 inhibitor NAI-like n=1 Tax=Hemicordylus capensis TaxID=884348 RepID=UPI0023044446|nr:phospholipase A2 inhibitor NAI-like [Hemicordylus capensis]